MTALITMFDTVTLDTVPPNPEAVAGYTSGSWPTFDPLVQRYPHAFHLSIAVTANHVARCLDVEPGDARPEQAPWWFRNRADHSHGKPILYTSASQMPGLIDVMTANGIHRDEYIAWSAHYNFHAHVCRDGACQYGHIQADMTQYDDRWGGRNLDASLVPLWVFAHPPKPDPYQYERYPVVPFQFKTHHCGQPFHLSERHTVQQYDLLWAARKRDRTKVAAVRAHIKILRDNVAGIAHYGRPHNPDWNTAHRGWRWQKLNDRLSGAVKLG